MDATVSTFSLDHLSNDDLLTSTRAQVGRSNQVLAGLLAHLAEVDARGVYRLRACSSLCSYCVYELRMSEDSAQRRAQAAKIARRFPVVFEQIAAGELHLTGVLMLGPHLTETNHLEVLAQAKHRTKRELAGLLRRLDPLPDVPARIEPLGPAASSAQSKARPAPARIESKQQASDGSQRQPGTPGAPSQVPPATERAVSPRQRGRPRSASAGPKAAGEPANRTIPAAVRRAVAERDQYRCPYVDDRGHRCRETSGLELHHEHAYALGGPATIANIALRCRAHNALAAEQDFGREFMTSVSARAPAPARSF